MLFGFIPASSNILFASIIFCSFNKFNFDYINCKKDNTCIVNNYTDVNSNEWYHDGIHFVLSNNIMIGTDTNIFDIDNKVTRAQIAMILYNIEGKPEVENNESFFFY